MVRGAVSFRLQNMPKNMPVSKRTNRKQKRKQNDKTSQLMTYSPVPPAYKTYFAYNELVNLLEPAAAAGYYYSFQLNNVYDPNFTGTGGQPISFDQWAQMYSRFRVWHIDVQIEFACNTNTPCVVGAYPSPLSTLPGSPRAWPLQIGAKHCMLSYNTGGIANKSLRFSINPWVWLGLTKEQYMNEADYSHSATAGPSRPLYLHVWTFGGLYSTIANVACLVTMKFRTELSEPVSLSFS